MTLYEAMIELSIQLGEKRTLGLSRQAEAIQLGIFALKRENSNRQRRPASTGLLPGEKE